MLVFQGSVRTETVFYYWLKLYLSSKNTAWYLISNNHKCDSCWYLYIYIYLDLLDVVGREWYLNIRSIFLSKDGDRLYGAQEEHRAEVANYKFSCFWNGGWTLKQQQQKISTFSNGINEEDLITSTDSRWHSLSKSCLMYFCSPLCYFHNRILCWKSSLRIHLKSPLQLITIKMPRVLNTSVV